MSTLQDILAKRSTLKHSLEEITKRSDKAFEVFSYSFPLSKFQDSLSESWKKLFYYRSHQNKTIGVYLSWKWKLDYTSVQDIFYDVTDARISRDDFAKKLEPIRTAVDQYIEGLKAKISEQDKELEQLYGDFAQNCGEFAALFNTPSVKKLIFKHLLQI